MNIIGIDLGKNQMNVCVMNSRGKVLKRFKCPSKQLLNRILLTVDKGIIAMEACGGSHYWSRAFESHGYEVRMMAGQFVKPYLKSNKNDDNDAEAICEAASRGNMRFVSVRTEEQQDIQNLHRIRERLVRQRTALSNEIRGLLMEYGIIIPQGLSHVRKLLPSIIEKNIDKSERWKTTFNNLHQEFTDLYNKIADYDAQLKEVVNERDDCKRLLEIPGVGYVTATAIVGAIGNASDFKNGRQFAAYLGLTPKQHSTGGKARLGKISKRGNGHIRKLLVQGASSFSIATKHKKNKGDELNQREQWYCDLSERTCHKKSIVAMANKTARIIWVVLMGNDFKQEEELRKENNKEEQQQELPLAA